MKKEQEMALIFERVESSIQEKMNMAFTDIVKEVNESVGRIITVTMNYSQFLQEAMKKDLTSVKTYFNGTRKVDRNKFGDKSDFDNIKLINAKTESNHESEDSQDTNEFFNMVNLDGIRNNNGDPTDNEKDEDTNQLANIDDRQSEEWENDSFEQQLRPDQIKKEQKQRSKLIDEISKLEKDLLSSSEDTSKEYQCLKCEFTSLLRSDVARHAANIHYNRKFKCLQCSFTTPSKDQLKRHAFTHVNPLPSK